MPSEHGCLSAKLAVQSSRERERWSEEDTSGDSRIERRIINILMYRKTREDNSTKEKSRISFF